MPEHVPHAFVTGAARGLGVHFVSQLAAQGFHVFATVRSSDDVAPVKALAGPSGKVSVLLGDVSDAAGIAGLVEQLGNVHVDLLVNNAGVLGEDRQVGALSWAEFERVFRVNTFAPAMLTQALLPHLRKGARKQVLNITSELGSITNAVPGFSYAYNASKAALNMITARTAKDLSGDGIMVISFCPGWNRTDMGGPNAPLDPKDSIKTMLATANRLTLKDSGKYLRIDGAQIPY